MSRYDVSRFWSNVEKTSGCWLWKRKKDSKGYGQLTVAAKSAIAHRVAYELLVGPIPDGAFVLHRCDVRACVRPDHLFLGTHADNMADMATKGRRRGPRNQGAENPRAKTTEDTVAKILAHAALGASVGSLAQHFNLSRRVIERIVSRQTWRHVQPKEVA